jgi:glyoxylase-like metal-dependent hydrolase (beta-lactamase superfamily II)
MVSQFRLSLSNIFLVKEDRSILVDTGKPNEAERIAYVLQQAGVPLTDLSLIDPSTIYVSHGGPLRPDDVIQRLGRFLTNDPGQV